MSEYVHIVCLDCPAPPDYGGAIDMYYKITSLHTIGKKIILHYFDYRKERNTKELAPYCSEIYAYKRKGFLQSMPFSKPFIVASRINKKLINRLNQDNHPVILEGIHCTGVLPHLKFSRKIIIRIHNDEAIYYNHLANVEKRLLKKIYYKREAQLLQKHQQKIKKHYFLACLSLTDVKILKEKYGFANAYFIPCFIPWQSLNSKPGKGEFFLYHGNMTVKENEAAAIWLIENVFQKSDLPFIIAGKGISKRVEAIATNPHIKLVKDPSMEDLDILVRNAHANVLPSMNATGVKLKLLHALVEGRFCFTNEEGVSGSSLEKMVTIANTNQNWIGAVTESVNKEFSIQEMEERKKVLDIYNNIENAKKLNGLL